MIEHFSEDAKRHLDLSVARYRDNLVDEARRLEKSIRKGQSEEITETIVRNAEDALRKSALRPKERLYTKLSRVCEPILAILIGVAFGKDVYQNLVGAMVIFVMTGILVWLLTMSASGGDDV